MWALEQNFLSNCPLHYMPLLYRRYVDDAFCIFQDKVQAESFLLYLNQQNHNISFTHEFKVNNSLPFLDVLITHTDKGFASNLYRKNTFTGLHTNFDSLSPIQYKVNLISVQILYHICSSYHAFFLLWVYTSQFYGY